MVLSARSWRRIRVGAAVVACFVLPLDAWVRGSGAFTMYARSEEYALRIVATRPDGRPVLVPPTALAARVGPTASHYFAGADHPTRAPNVDVLRAQLPAVARLACDTGRDLGLTPERIDVGLWEKPLGATDGAWTHEERACTATR